jgi:hypothetical protein
MAGPYKKVSTKDRRLLLWFFLLSFLESTVEAVA